MGQLHEILAIEQDVKQKKKEMIQKINSILSNSAVFDGYRKKIEFFEEDRKNEEKTEMQKVQCTVNDVKKVLIEGISRWFDLRYQKEDSNQKAIADIVIGNKAIIKDVPVTFLLAMEEELKELLSVIKNFPTLSKAIDWKKLDDNTYQSEQPVERPKTEKTWLHKVLYDATKEHPAQIKEWSEDRPCGRSIEDKWSGMIPESEKNKYIERCERLYFAIKRARQKANTFEVNNFEIGKDLLNFIFGEGS